MEKKKPIPTQTESPSGLHQRYSVKKLKPFMVIERGSPQYIGYKAVPVDEDAEYFVMRLDEGCSDLNHLKACRVAVRVYADLIKATIPGLAKDLLERYPLIP